jgi:hypothetical protein
VSEASGFLLKLLRLVATGRVTLEQLDVPPPGWRDNAAAMKRQALAHQWPLPVYRNLAREWIEGNPQEWAQLQTLHPRENGFGHD